jgi:hypothetical protein
VGSLNPKIFQPAWFWHYDLLKKEEADAAKIEIIHPDVVVFSLDWLRIEVTRDRFTIRTPQEPYDQVIRDIALGTFDLLQHTPLTAMGINRSMHFSMGSEERWHAAGHRLTPKGVWSEILEQPGMRAIVMQGQRQDGLKGNQIVQVEPSTTVEFGIFVLVNDHYAANPETMGAGEMVAILKDKWEASYQRSEETIYSLLERLHE